MEGNSRQMDPMEGNTRQMGPVSDCHLSGPEGLVSFFFSGLNPIRHGAHVYHLVFFG